jgi:hypothetical protein
MLLRLLRPSDPGVDQAPGHDEDRTQTDGMRRPGRPPWRRSRRAGTEDDRASPRRLSGRSLSIPEREAGRAELKWHCPSSSLEFRESCEVRVPPLRGGPAFFTARLQRDAIPQEFAQVASS